MIRRPPRSTRTDTLFPYTTLFRSDRRALLRQGQNGRDPRRFRPAEPGRVMAEIALGARICTKGADAGLGYVEIDLHDPVLAPEQFDQHREPRLQAFAHPGTALPQKGVLGGLLRSEERRVGKERVSTCRCR